MVKMAQERGELAGLSAVEVAVGVVAAVGRGAAVAATRTRGVRGTVPSNFFLTATMLCDPPFDPPPPSTSVNHKTSPPF